MCYYNFLFTLFFFRTVLFCFNLAVYLEAILGYVNASRPGVSLLVFALMIDAFVFLYLLCGIT